MSNSRNRTLRVVTSVFCPFMVVAMLLYLFLGDQTQPISPGGRILVVAGIGCGFISVYRGFKEAFRKNR